MEIKIDKSAADAIAETCDALLKGEPPVAGSANCSASELRIIHPKEFAAKLPASESRPADHGLWLAVQALEFQLGTIEAYNRLVGAAGTLRDKIDADQSEAPDPTASKWRRGKTARRLAPRSLLAARPRAKEQTADAQMESATPRNAAKNTTP